jgi:hypothetical protein
MPPDATRREEHETVPALRLKLSRTRLSGVAALSLLAAGAMAGPAGAQEAAGDKAAPIKLQVNKFDTVGDACRLTTVIDNSRGEPLKSLKIDIFAFDTDGVAQKRILTELGPLSGRKTSVKQFDLQGIACAKIGRLLLNDVTSCDGGDREACLARLELDSKVGIPFDR